jgi:hypothetical protein
MGFLNKAFRKGMKKHSLDKCQGVAAALEI